MKDYFLYAGMALALFALWVMARRDWVRVTSPSCKVTAEVIDHRQSYSDGTRCFAAIYRFAADGTEHHVTDQVYGSTRSPPVGSVVMLAYPAGRPDMARPPRLLMWTLAYAVILFMLGVLVASKLGYLPKTGTF